MFISRKTKKLLIFIAVFLAVCGLGLFVALAGGVRWGTEGAGLCAGMTILIAFMVAVPATESLA